MKKASKFILLAIFAGTVEARFNGGKLMHVFNFHCFGTNFNKFKPFSVLQIE